MKSHADKNQATQSRSTAAKAGNENNQASAFQFLDSRPEAIQMRKLQELAGKSHHVQQLRTLQEMTSNSLKPEAIQMRKLQELADKSHHVQQLRALQEMTSNSLKVKQNTQLHAKADNFDSNKQQPLYSKNSSGLTVANSVIQRVEVTKEEAGGLYDSSGKEKWREFIDEKDHADALKKFRAGEISHPGEYYDYFHNGGIMIKKSDAFADFVRADNFVKSRIGKKVSVEEYIHIHDLAIQSGGALNQGLRNKDVSWGLPLTATGEQLGNIREKGLDISTDRERHKVTVPMPREGITNKLSMLFDEYHAAQEKAESQTDKFNNIISLYQELEALHAFKDGTSRTNHLLLNKLLSEHGLGPAILQEPNSPMFRTEEFGAEVLKGISAHSELRDQGGRSQEELSALRAQHLPKELSREERLVNERMRKLGFKSDEGPQMPEFGTPRNDPDVSNERLDFDALKRRHGLAPEFDPFQSSVIDLRGGREPMSTVLPKPEPPKTLTALDKLLLAKFMGPRKAEEVDKLYADQLRRFRDKYGY